MAEFCNTITNLHVVDLTANPQSLPIHHNPISNTQGYLIPDQPESLKELHYYYRMKYNGDFPDYVYSPNSPQLPANSAHTKSFGIH